MEKKVNIDLFRTMVEKGQQLNALIDVANKCWKEIIVLHEQLKGFREKDLLLIQMEERYEAFQTTVSLIESYAGFLLKTQEMYDTADAELAAKMDAFK